MNTANIAQVERAFQGKILLFTALMLHNELT